MVEKLKKSEKEWKEEKIEKKEKILFINLEEAQRREKINIRNIERE